MTNIPTSHDALFDIIHFITIDYYFKLRLNGVQDFSIEMDKVNIF